MSDCPNGMQSYNYRSKGKDNARCCPGEVININDTSGCNYRVNNNHEACSFSSSDITGECKMLDCTKVTEVPKMVAGPPGPEGPQGQQGPQGPKGTTTIQTLNGSIDTNIYEKVKYSSTSLMMNTSSATFTGSGFIIKYKNKNYIVTVAHNVMIGNRNNLVSEINASILLPNGTPMLVPCKVIGVAGAADVAVVEILNNNLGELKHVEWSSSEVKTGDIAHVVGDPLGIDAISIAQGSVRDSAYIAAGNIIESICVSVAIQSGNSGSPIFNIIGEIIGIVSYSYGDAENFGWGCSHKLMKYIVENIIDRYTITGTVSNFIGGTLGQNMTAVDSLYLLTMGITNYPLTGFYFNTYDDGWSPYYIIEEIDDEVIGVYDTQKTPYSIYTQYNKQFQLKIKHIQYANYEQTVYRKPRLLTLAEDVPLGGSSNNSDLKLVEPIKKNSHQIILKKEPMRKKELMRKTIKMIL